MAVSKAMLKNAFDMFDLWGKEAITDSTRSQTLIRTAQTNVMWESFEGIDSAALFVSNFSKGWNGERTFLPVSLLQFRTSPTTYVRALHYLNGLVCHDEKQEFLGQEWITYCHPMTVEKFRNRLST